MSIRRNLPAVALARNSPWGPVQGLAISAIAVGMYHWGWGFKPMNLNSDMTGPIAWEQYHRPTQTIHIVDTANTSCTLPVQGTVSDAFPWSWTATSNSNPTFTSSSIAKFPTNLEFRLDPDAPLLPQILMLLISNLAIIAPLLQLVPHLARFLTSIFNVFKISALLRVVGVEWFCNYFGIMWILRQLGFGTYPSPDDIPALLQRVETILRNANIITNARIRSAMDDSISRTERGLNHLGDSLQQAIAEIHRDNTPFEDVNKALNDQALALIAMRDQMNALPETVREATEEVLQNDSAISNIAENILEYLEKNFGQLTADVKASVQNRLTEITDQLRDMREAIVSDTSKVLRENLEPFQRDLKSELKTELNSTVAQALLGGDQGSLLETIRTEFKSEISSAMAKNMGALQKNLSNHSQQLQEGLRADFLAGVVKGRDANAPITQPPQPNPVAVTKEDLKTVTKEYFTEVSKNLQVDVQKAIQSFLPAISKDLQTDVHNSIELLLPSISEKLQADVHEATDNLLPYISKNLPNDINKAMEILLPQISDKLHSDVRNGIENLHTEVSENLKSDVHQTMRSLFLDTGMEGLALQIAQDVTAAIHDEVDSMNMIVVTMQHGVGELMTTLETIGPSMKSAQLGVPSTADGPAHPEQQSAEENNQNLSGPEFAGPRSRGPPSPPKSENSQTTESSHTSMHSGRPERKQLDRGELPLPARPGRTPAINARANVSVPASPPSKGSVLENIPSPKRNQQDQSGLGLSIWAKPTPPGPNPAAESFVPGVPALEAHTNVDQSGVGTLGGSDASPGSDGTGDSNGG